MPVRRSIPLRRYRDCDWLRNPVARCAAFVCCGALVLVSPDVRAAEVDERPATITSEATSPQASAEAAAALRNRDPRSLADLLALQKSVQEQAIRVMPATVAVRIGRAQGSGVIVTEDGYILTAAHVSNQPDRPVTITLHDGRTVRGRTLGLTRPQDAGMIKITEAGKWPHVEMGDSEAVKIGEWCLALGHPGGYRPGRPPVVRLGRVVSRSETRIQTDCSLVGGDSGGPLFDLEGRVIGIHSRIGAASDWNFHVPMRTFAASWEQLAAPDIRIRPVLGVRGVDHDDGCQIVEVIPKLPASRVDLQAGDVIVLFNGKPVEGIVSLIELVQGHDVGDKITLRVRRDEQQFERSVKLAAEKR